MQKKRQEQACWYLLLRVRSIAVPGAASAGPRTSVKATNSARGLRLCLLHFAAGCDTARIDDVVAAKLRAVVANFLDITSFRETATARLSSMTKMLRYFNYMLAAAP